MVAVEPELPALEVHRDLQGLRVIRVLLALPDLRAMLVNVALLDRKALRVFRVPLDLLEAELEEPRYLVPRGIRALPDLLDLRVRMAQLAPRVLQDLLESVALQVRML